jgi:hypothetical protein
MIQPYFEAGASWWMETINDAIGTFGEMRERILQGPPKIRLNTRHLPTAIGVGVRAGFR